MKVLAPILGYLLAVLGVALVAAQADAAVWVLYCDQAQNRTVTSLRPGQRACAYPTSVTDHPEIVGTVGCENVDGALFEDGDGDGTGAPALTATLQACAKPQDAFADSTARDNHCVDYSSGTLTGEGILQGAGPPADFLRWKLGGAFAGDPILSLRCNF